MQYASASKLFTLMHAHTTHACQKIETHMCTHMHSRKCWCSALLAQTCALSSQSFPLPPQKSKPCVFALFCCFNVKNMGGLGVNHSATGLGTWGRVDGSWRSEEEGESKAWGVGKRREGGAEGRVGVPTPYMYAE